MTIDNGRLVVENVHCVHCYTLPHTVHVHNPITIVYKYVNAMGFLHTWKVPSVIEKHLLDLPSFNIHIYAMLHISVKRCLRTPFIDNQIPYTQNILHKQAHLSHPFVYCQVNE